MSSKSSRKHSCDKCFSPGTSNISLDGSDLSVRTNDIHGNSYANMSSPSSSASIITMDQSSKPRSKGNCHRHRRRCRHEKLFHYTHSLNRQYIVTMTNILFHMQKEIYKLKRRTQHVEQMLANQTQPIIRIPRLTKDELTTICVNDRQTQQDVTPAISDEENSSSPRLVENDETLNEIKESTTSPISFQTTNQTTHPPPTRTKYCKGCAYEFSHRSAFLRHIKRIHHGVCPTELIRNQPEPIKIDDSYSAPSVLTTDQAEGENDSFQVLVNDWDYGEGRLRPRPAPKQSLEPVNKVKCDICNKFFRAEYIKKHKRRAHRVMKSTSLSESINKSEQIVSTTVQSVESVQTNVDQSPTTNENSPSTITIAEMDVDDNPIQFRKEPTKALFIASTCLERDQIEIFEKFLEKFSPRVYQSPAVTSRTTHLIINDDAHLRRSPLSMKLIEGIANHCYCVSYRWLLTCIQYDRIVDEVPFEIEGDSTDYHQLGGPKRSRLTEKQHSLFEDICFIIKCSEDNDIRMSNDRLQSLVTTCGGRIITCVTQSLLNECDIIVVCDQTYVSERRHNYDQCKKLGILFVSIDWVLESILEYQLKEFSLYEAIPS